jgi:hypothetical protein
MPPFSFAFRDTVLKKTEKLFPNMKGARINVEGMVADKAGALTARRIRQDIENASTPRMYAY